MCIKITMNVKRDDKKVYTKKTSDKHTKNQKRETQVIITIYK